MFRRSRLAIPRSTAHLAKRLTQPFSKRNLFHAARAMGPTLVALSFAGVAHAQGTMDFSGVVVPDAEERRELTHRIRNELRQQGRLATESQVIPILVKQDFGNPRLAANYAPGDEIHYKAGSPAEHGIANNSTATVVYVVPRTNTLTVATRDGNEVSYNPALLKTQTAQSTVYREEQREVAVGERIRFTDSDHDANIRSGDFATVERIAENNSLSVRLDNGKSVKLGAARARHIEYGYAVDIAHGVSADRVLVTGDAVQLAQQYEAFTRLSPHIRDLGLYTSNSRDIAVERAVPGVEKALSDTGLSPDLDGISAPSIPQVELEGFGIGL